MMKRLLSLFLCVASFLCAGSNGFALTIPASEDSVGYNNQISASGNAAVQLAVDVNHKAFIYFNLNDIPTNAVVRWAKLRMFLPTVTAKGSGLSIYQVGGVWNECKPSVMPFIQPYAVASISADQLGNKRFVTVDVTATVQNWISMKAPNEGFAIAPTLGYYGTSSLTLTSKEGPSLGIPAELDIEFQPESSQITLEQLPGSLKMLLSPNITTQPTLNLYMGSISADAKGVGNLTYQWYKNGIPVGGATLASLQLNGLSSGNYTLRTTNGFTTATSSTVAYDASKYDPNFSLIPAGTFTMGNGSAGDGIEHTVNVSAFWIGKTDVTYGEWNAVKSWAVTHGYQYDNTGSGNGDNYPVTNVSWYDVVKWTNAKSEMEGLTPVYYTNASFAPDSIYRAGQVWLLDDIVNWKVNGFRLPTDAEWEKAARGGLIGKLYPNGDTLTSNDAKVDWSPFSTAVVKSYMPNGYGLYDMVGNVWQWCWDCGPTPGSCRIARGFDYIRSVSACRVSARYGAQPDVHGDLYGFRLVHSAFPPGFPSVGQPVLSGTALAVNTQGKDPLNYQWFYNGTPIVSGTLKILSLQGLSSAGTYSVRVTNTLGAVTSSVLDVSIYDLPPEYAPISGGTFTMGNSSAGDGLERMVNVDAFLIGKTKVTYAEWKTVKAWADTHGYDFDNFGKTIFELDYSPVVDVSWFDVVKWSNAKSEMQGLVPVYYTDATFSSDSVYRTGHTDVSNWMVNWSANGYRLPTEAEWEKAARGGLVGKLYQNGDTLPSTNLDGYGTNGYGLYDITTPFGEWCWDWYGDYNRLNDQQGPLTGDYRVVRGGSLGIVSQSDSSRVSYRGSGNPNFSGGLMGLRLVRNALPAGFPSVGRPVVSDIGISVSTQGTNPLNYQWFSGSTPILSGTMSTLSKSGLSSGTYSVVVTNSIGSVTSTPLIIDENVFSSQYVLIPSGTFTMGGRGRNITSEPTEHTVNVSSFWIAKTDVTFAEWKTVKAWAESHGYNFDNQGTGNGDTHPVTKVNWYDVVKWSNAKSEMQSLTPVYYTGTTFSPTAVYRSGQLDVNDSMVNWNARGYRLPTEAEWEKAARGGLIGRIYPNGDTLTSKDANFNYNLMGSDGTTPVKSYPSNGYGLYDMAGNVFQWCWDVSQRGRSLRGGSFLCWDFALSVSHSFGNSPDGAADILGIYGVNNGDFGFRLVRGSVF